MKSKFEIKNGYLVFEQDRISICDNTKRDMYLNIFIVIALFTIGLVDVVRYYNGSVELKLYFGIFSFILAIGIYIDKFYNENFAHNIAYVELEKVEIKRDYSDVLIMVFIKKNKRKRRVILGFEKQMLADFENALRGKMIKARIEC